MTAKGYDIIGDVHGHADPLEELLRDLGYEHRRGAYRHSEREAIFLGDLIDRGPHQRRTLDLVRPMIECGSAQAVLGNHEFNAICYAARIGDEFVRPHTDKNNRQHSAFLQELPFASEIHSDVVRWFRSLPAYLDLGEIGVVHACWCRDSFAALDPYLLEGRRISDAALHQYAVRGSAVHHAIERILKGPEHDLPEALWFRDKDGHRRSKARLRWWTSSGLPASQRLEFGGATLSAEKLARLDWAASVAEHPTPDKPVFIGHYWLRGKPAPLSDKVACVDYSVAKGGKLAAYRWSGERTLSADNFQTTA